MTLWRRRYFDEIAKGLTTVDPDFRVFRLVADPSVLRARILASDDGRGWRLGHMESGLRVFSDPHFGEAICADGSPDEIVQELGARLR